MSFLRTVLLIRDVFSFIRDTSQSEGEFLFRRQRKYV